MQKTSKGELENAICLDTKGLMRLLNCGYSTAQRIAEESHAKFKIGKRVLYDRQKIENYISSQSN